MAGKWRLWLSSVLIGVTWGCLVPEQPRSVIGTVVTIALMLVWTKEPS